MNPLAQRRLAVLCAALFTAAFLLTWWNRFLGTNAVDGVFVYAAQRLLEGHIPYRDFGLVVPPFEVFVSAVCLHFFPGEPFAAVRMFGLLERCACAAFLTLWLMRVFPPAASFMATAVSMILFSASSADPMAGYNQSASTWAVIAGYFASGALDPERRLSSACWNAFLAGLAAACALLIKQTTGLGLAAALALVLTVSLWKLATPARAFSTLAVGIAGWLLVLGATLSWLAASGGLHAFIDQTFLQGATSKGPLWISLLRPLRMTLEDPWLRQEAVLAIVLVAAVYGLTRGSAESPRPADSVPGLLSVLGLLSMSLLALAGGYGLVLAAPQLAGLRRLDILERLAIYVTLAGCGAISLGQTWDILRTRAGTNAIAAQLWLFALVSLAIGYMHALSFVITNGIFVPGLAFLLALALSRLEFKAKPAAYALLLLCLLAISVNAFRKWMTPFGWYGYRDVPVTEASASSPVPGLRHMHGGAEQVEFNARLVQYLEQYSGPRHESYLFFYLPQLYVLSHTHPVTYSFSPFIDVASDAVARRDAQTLRENPPPILIYTVVGQPELATWEQEFRAGKPSGQRDLVTAIEEIAAADYDLRDTLLMPGSHRPVKVYVRRAKQ